MEDESHLVWGDVCGYVWAKKGEVIDIEMTNYRQRQTFYGAVNVFSQEFHLKAFPNGDGDGTVAYLEWLRSIYPDRKLLIIWDGARYHRYGKMPDYLAEINAGLEKKDWLVTCELFAPNAPEQNPVEDIWLKGKNYLRRHFSKNKTFSQVVLSFSSFLDHNFFDSAKFSWYLPSPHLI